MTDLKSELLHVGWSKGKRRAEEDYYVTPPLAVRELLKRETFDGSVWEPASGNGAIARFFPNCMASDSRRDTHNQVESDDEIRPVENHDQ